jgi:hypothetical protein
MIRKLLTTLLALASLAFVLSPVFGDEGRDGGIVVLPAAQDTFSSSRVTIGTYVFEPGEDVRLQMPVELMKAVTLWEVEGTIVATGSINGRMLVVHADEIRDLQAAGVSLFRIYVVGPDYRNLILDFQILADGRVILRVS